MLPKTCSKMFGVTWKIDFILRFKKVVVRSNSFISMFERPKFKDALELVFV